MVNQRDGTAYTVPQLKQSFYRIVKSGLRPPMPRAGSYHDFKRLEPSEIKALAIADEYQKALSDAIRKKQISVSRADIIAEIGRKHNLTPEQVQTRFRIAQTAARLEAKWAEEQSNPKFPEEDM